MPATEAPPLGPVWITSLPPIAETVAQLLGDPWAVDQATTNHGYTLLTGPDGRELGMRTLHIGRTVQLWIVGFAVPDLPQNAPREEHAAHARRLASGRRWHTVQHLSHLIADGTPSDQVDIPAALHKLISERLLPAYEIKPAHVEPRPCPEPYSPRKVHSSRAAAAIPTQSSSGPKSQSIRALRKRPATLPSP
jgi:hypothetical protein